MLDLDGVFFGADAFFDAAFFGVDAFLEEDFFTGAALFGAAGAASSAFIEGLRSRLLGAAVFDENKLATINKICTTIPRARIPTVTPATSASGESIFNNAFLAVALAYMIQNQKKTRLQSSRTRFASSDELRPARRARARLATTPPSDDTENTRLSSVSPHTTPHAPSSVVTRAPGDARNTAAGVETHPARVPSRSERHRAVERADGFQKK